MYEDGTVKGLDFHTIPDGSGSISCNGNVTTVTFTYDDAGDIEYTITYTLTKQGNCRKPSTAGSGYSGHCNFEEVPDVEDGGRSGQKSYR